MLAKSYLLKARTVGPDHPFMAIREIQKGISEDSTLPELWYNLGGIYYTVRLYDSARYAWMRTLQLKPDTETVKAAIGGLNAVRSVEGK